MGDLWGDLWGTVTYLGFSFRYSPEFYGQWRKDNPQREMVCFKVRLRRRLCFLAGNKGLTNPQGCGKLGYLAGN